MTPWGLLYVLPNENLAATGLSVNTGTVDTENPIDAVYDELQNVPTYITPSAGGIDIVWDHGSAKRLDVFYVGPTNLPESAVVTVQRHTSDSWGAPTQAVVTAIDQRPDGFSNNAYANLWFDPTTGAEVTGYSAGGYRYTRLHITSAGSDPISFKEFWMGPANQLDPNISWGVRFPMSRKVNVRRTNYGGKHKYDYGVTLRKIVGKINTSAAGYAQITTWWETVKGELLPSLVVPDPLKNDAYLVDWPKDFDPELNFFEDIDIVIELEELARGLA